MTTYVCAICGSADIEIKAWVKANENVIVEWAEDDMPMCWCNECLDRTEYRIKNE